MLTYDQIIDSIRHWALAEEDVRAALIVGSRARTDHPADEWSDLDVVLFVRDPEVYTKSEHWVAAIAPVWLSFIERTGDGRAWERRALYAGGLDVDFALNPAAALDVMMEQGLDEAAADVIRRGTRILVDKEGALTKLQMLPIPPTAPFHQPSVAEFQQVVNNFWYHTQWTAKHLRRGELWWAKSGCDWHLKALLQQMLEWHTHATKGAAHDTWMRGRFLEEWADTRAVAQLPTVFAHYNSQSIARALRGTMRLFHWLTQETAQSWGYSYPEGGVMAAGEFTEKLLDQA